jgi:hypothetical protein
VDIRFWGKGDRHAPTWVVDRALRQLGDAGETGVLFLRASGETDSEIHLRGGHVVGCFCVADEWLLARRLVGAGLVAPQDLGALATSGTELHDSIDEVGLVDPMTLHSVLAGRFRDTFHFACATSWRSIEFLRLGSLALPPSAPGVVPSALLARVVEPTSLAMVLARMAGDGSVLFEDELRGTIGPSAPWGWIHERGTDEEDGRRGSAVMMEEE